MATTPAAAVAVVEAAVAADTNQLRMSERAALSGGLFTREPARCALLQVPGNFPPLPDCDQATEPVRDIAAASGNFA